MLIAQTVPQPPITEFQKESDMTVIQPLLVIALVLFTSSSFAASTHGLALHGEPKYPADFEHFDYVNP